MIDRLLDNIHWQELPKLISRQIGHAEQRFNTTRGWKAKKKLLDFQCFLELFRSNRESFYFDSKNEFHLKNRKKYWSAKRLSHYWSKNLLILKEGFISDIADDFFDKTAMGLGNKTVWQEFKKDLEKEKNLQNIFILWQHSSHLAESYANDTLKEYLRGVKLD